MKIECQFKTLEWFQKDSYYSCKISDQNIPENQQLKFVGRNENGKCRMDIVAIYIQSCTMTKVPQRLTEFFPNLEVMLISNTTLMSLNKKDLAEYKKLKNISFYNNKIEFLPGNLFEGFKNLEGISFYKNNLNYIEPNIFDGLDKLKYVDLGNNPKFNMIYSKNPKYSPTTTLEGLKIDILNKFKSRVKLPVELENENLKMEIRELKKKLNSERNEHIKKTNEIQNFEMIVTNLELALAVQRSENYKLTKKVENQTKIESKSVNSLTVDLIKLIHDETFKDFKIIIDEHEFLVHKFLLAARSPTLAEMFRNNPEVEKLKLVDIPIEIFEHILKFLYTDEPACEDKVNFVRLFVAAGRLGIEQLKNFAATEILKDINEENALEILNLSNKYGHNELRQKAFDEIKKNYPKIDFKDEWIKDGEKMGKFIEAFKVREELMRKAEEEFQKMLI